ncbi:MAG: zinc ribbon domain-containing protein, partial [Thermoplasmatales archaeon]
LSEVPLESQMGWVHGSQMTRVYVHDNSRETDVAVLKAYGIPVEEDVMTIRESKPLKCPRCSEANDPKARFCWKCGMILDKTLTEKKLMDEAKEIESSLLKSDVVDNSTKNIIQQFPPEFKDLILETVLKQIVESPELREKFQREIAETK